MEQGNHIRSAFIFSCLYLKGAELLVSQKTSTVCTEIRFDPLYAKGQQWTKRILRLKLFWVTQIRLLETSEMCMQWYFDGHLHSFNWKGQCYLCVSWAAFGLGVELGREDGLRVMHDALGTTERKRKKKTVHVNSILNVHSCIDALIIFFMVDYIIYHIMIFTPIFHSSIYEIF